jgi:hypothetical protein
VPKPSKKFIEGFLAAIAEVSAATASRTLDDFSDKEWELMRVINERLWRYLVKYTEPMNKG